MLSSILRSKRAIEVNIQIMLIFSKIREMLLDSLSMKLDIEEIKRRLNSQDKSIELVFSCLDELIEKRKNSTTRKPIGFQRNTDQFPSDEQISGNNSMILEMSRTSSRLDISLTQSTTGNPAKKFDGFFTSLSNLLL